ncbi:hypothetical protein E2C01_017607 [Portunus trituberculatus]|uniref:Uncharacterized protein n=1 Tax=Portunus trituberculatus TaxID=210409 RepID=A0A5B7DTZ7_PORTR|nr:hypothetical protein [Portunus trituberculatus]
MRGSKHLSVTLNCAGVLYGFITAITQGMQETSDYISYSETPSMHHSTRYKIKTPMLVQEHTLTRPLGTINYRSPSSSHWKGRVEDQVTWQGERPPVGNTLEALV